MPTLRTFAARAIFAVLGICVSGAVWATACFEIPEKPAPKSIPVEQYEGFRTYIHFQRWIDAQLEKASHIVVVVALKGNTKNNFSAEFLNELMLELANGASDFRLENILMENSSGALENMGEIAGLVRGKTLYIFGNPREMSPEFSGAFGVDLWGSFARTSGEMIVIHDDNSLEWGKVDAAKNMGRKSGLTVQELFTTPASDKIFPGIRESQNPLISNQPGLQHMLGIRAQVAMNEWLEFLAKESKQFQPLALYLILREGSPGLDLWRHPQSGQIWALLYEMSHRFKTQVEASRSSTRLGLYSVADFSRLFSETLRDVLTERLQPKPRKVFVELMAIRDQYEKKLREMDQFLVARAAAKPNATSTLKSLKSKYIEATIQAGKLEAEMKSKRQTLTDLTGVPDFDIHLVALEENYTRRLQYSLRQHQVRIGVKDFDDRKGYHHLQEGMLTLRQKLGI